MEKHILTNYTETEFQQMIEQAIAEYDKRKTAEQVTGKNYSIAKVAQMLGRSHTTIKNLVKTGKLKTTSEGRRITHQALQDYLSTELK
jgi:transposase